MELDSFGVGEKWFWRGCSQDEAARQGEREVAPAGRPATEPRRD